MTHNCIVLVTDPGRSTHQLLINELQARFNNTHVVVPSQFSQYKLFDTIKGQYLWINNARQ